MHIEIFSSFITYLPTFTQTSGGKPVSQRQVNINSSHTVFLIAGAHKWQVLIVSYLLSTLNRVGWSLVEVNT